MNLTRAAGQRDSKVRTNKTTLTYYRSGSTKSASPLNVPTSHSDTWHRFIVRFIDATIISVILFCLGYSLLVQPHPRVQINSSSYRQPSTYQIEAAKDLTAIKNRTKISLDEQGIIKSLQIKFPEIINGTVELPLFSEQPTIHLNIAQPAFFLNSKASTYIISSEGVAVAKSTDLPSIKNLPVVIDQSGFEASGGKRILAASSISFIKTLIAECQHANVPISSLTIPPKAQEVDLRTSDRPYYTKFFLNTDALVQSGQFLAARHQFDTNNSQPAEYLDVRVQGKIFYK